MLKRKAFSLIELLLTIAIIGLLASVMLISFGRVIKKTKAQMNLIYGWKNRSIEAGIQYDTNDELINYTTNVPIKEMWIHAIK